MNDTTVRRTDSVRVKLAPDMLDRVEKLANLYGMPTATLCAFAVAEWISGKENALQLSRMAVMDIGRKVGGAIETQMQALADDPEFLAMSLQATSPALTQVNLPLDSEAPKGGA
jgi:hypothetical protein